MDPVFLRVPPRISVAPAVLSKITLRAKQVARIDEQLSDCLIARSVWSWCGLLAGNFSQVDCHYILENVRGRPFFCAISEGMVEEV